MFVHLLGHVGHCGVADLQCVPVHDPHQLMVERKLGIHKFEEFLAIYIQYVIINLCDINYYHLWVWLRKSL